MNSDIINYTHKVFIFLRLSKSKLGKGFRLAPKYSFNKQCKKIKPKKNEDNENIGLEDYENIQYHRCISIIDVFLSYGPG